MWIDFPRKKKNINPQLLGGAPTFPSVVASGLGERLEASRWLASLLHRLRDDLAHGMLQRHEGDMKGGGDELALMGDGSAFWEEATSPGGSV